MIQLYHVPQGCSTAVCFRKTVWHFHNGSQITEEKILVSIRTPEVIKYLGAFADSR